jgi:iron-sulfur cluster repair protein YtfE (RIC family)
MKDAKNTLDDSAHLKSDHRELMQQLSELDQALESLICYSEVYADLAGVQRAMDTARWLAGRLPDHFVREEQGIFATIAKLGPDSAAFAQEMRGQHTEIGQRIDSFRKAAESFIDAPDLQQSIGELKDAGKALASLMAAHMGAEERKYALLG